MKAIRNLKAFSDMRSNSTGKRVEKGQEKTEHLEHSPVCMKYSFNSLKEATKVVFSGDFAGKKLKFRGEERKHRKLVEGVGKG